MRAPVGEALTLHGANARSHDALSGDAGGFVRLIREAQRRRAAGERLALRLFATRSALPELRAMAVLALGLGAAELRLAAALDEGDEGLAFRVPRWSSLQPTLDAVAAAIARARRPLAVEDMPRCLVPATAASQVREGDFTPRCDGCQLRPRCDGAPRRYLARFGDGELRPRTA